MVSGYGESRKQRTPALISVVLATLFILSPVVAASGFTPSTVVLLTVYIGEPLSVFSPYPSNFTQVSVVGTPYDLQTQQVSFVPSQTTSGSSLVHSQLTGDEIMFTAESASPYTLWANVSSTGPTYVLISNGTVNGGSLLKNVTSIGPLSLEIVMSVVPPPPQNPGWNPLFGFTGLSLGGLNITGAEALAAVAALAVAFIGIGMVSSRKLMWLGVVLAFGLAGAIAGILIILLALASYVGSFLVLRAYFGLSGKRASAQQADSP